MTNIIVVNFDSFKRIIKNKRLYYYIGENVYEFHFLAEGLIVKTIIPKMAIENEQRFFSDPLFYNAIQLMFRLPHKETDLSEIEGIRLPLEEPIIDVREVQDDEVKNIDIQSEEIKPEIGG